MIAAAAAMWQPESSRLALLAQGLVRMTIAHREHRAGLRCEVLARCGRSPLSVEPNDGAQPVTILRDKYGKKVRHHLRRRGDQSFDRELGRNLANLCKPLCRWEKPVAEARLCLSGRVYIAS